MTERNWFKVNRNNSISSFLPLCVCVWGGDDECIAGGWGVAVWCMKEFAPLGAYSNH